MVQERRAIDALDPRRGARQGRFGVADHVASARVRGLETLRYPFGNLLAINASVRPLAPLDRHGLQRGFRLPPRIGHHRDRIIEHRHHLSHARALQRGIGIKARQLAAEHRALRKRRRKHVRQSHVNAIKQRPVQLRRGIEPGQRLADEGPVRLGLQRHVLGHRQLARRLRQLAVAQRPSGPCVRYDAKPRPALHDGHPPPLGRRLHQHRSRCGAALHHVGHRRAQPAAAARQHVAPGVLMGEIHVRRHQLRPHAAPIGLQLLRHQLCQVRERALAHLRARDPHHDGVVGLDHHPEAEFGPRGRTLRAQHAAGHGPAQRKCARRRQETASAESAAHHAWLRSAFFSGKERTRLPVAA